MKSVNAAEAQARLDEILDEVQRQPIIIRDPDRDIAVVLSVAHYERLRMSAVQGFLDVRNEVARDAAVAGLTEARMIELLIDEETGEHDLTAEQRAELDRRWTEHLSNPGSALSWEEVRRKLRDRT